LASQTLSAAPPGAAPASPEKGPTAGGRAGAPARPAPGAGRTRRFGRLLLTPALLGWVLIGVVPLLFIVANSFFESTLGKPLRRWAGLENYQEALGDPDAVAALWRTAAYALGVTAASVALGVVLALAVYSAWRRPGALRAVLLVPLFIPPVVVGVLFKQVFNPEGGLLAVLAKAVGLPAPGVLSSADSALFGVAAADVWEWTPLVFLLVLAALLTVDRSVLEAARLDGAHGPSLFSGVLWPAIAAAVASAALIRLVLAFKVFDLVSVMTSGGPGQSTTVASYLIHRVALREFDLGRASVLTLALAVLVTLITLPFIALNSRASRLEEEEGA
jgi:multiple sugar transport system permease protein